MIRVTEIFRHPLKSHGREALKSVTLHQGQSMPFDRLWGVAHEAAKADGTDWAPCQEFSRTSKAPRLAPINAVLDEATETLTLTHPDLPDLTFQPDTEADKLLEWVQPIVPQDRALPARILRLAERGFTDTPFASVSLNNIASHRAVEALAGSPLSPLRWRGNIWFEGAPAWEEFEWMGRDLRLGDAVLQVKERIVRCLATTANPKTGVRDVDTLRALGMLDHQDFGIYCSVIQSGDVKVGDKLELI